jgi:hypothetical protein
VPRVRDRWHKNFRHSDFLTADFCSRFWAPIFAEGKIVEGDPAIPPSFLIRLITKVQPRFVLPGLLSFLLGIAVNWWWLHPDVVWAESVFLSINGTRYKGSVFWDSDVELLGVDETPVLFVRGYASVPSAGVELNFAMHQYPIHDSWDVRHDEFYRRNKCQQGFSNYCRPSLPQLNASHVILLHFQNEGSELQVVSAPAVSLIQGGKSESKCLWH